MKRSTTLLLLICTFFLGAISSLAQSPCEELPLPQERVALHLDRNVCLAGDTLWFKAWCFLEGQLEQEMSKVLYVEIFDETGKAIVQDKYLLNNNTAAGAIHIPADVPSKYYFLKAYTRYMRNFSPAEFHYQQLTIANPLIVKPSLQAEAIPAQDDQKATPPPPPTSFSAEQRLEIALDKQQYAPRQPITFAIRSPQPITAELAATVRLQGLGNQPAPTVTHRNKWLLPSCQADPFCRSDAHAPAVEADKTLPSAAHSLQWLPETRGLTISGYIQNEAQKKAAATPLIVAVLQDAPMLHLGTTDDAGNFTIALQNMERQQELFIGTPDEQDKVLIRNDFETELPAITTVPLRYDSTLHQLLEATHLHQQLDQAYPAPATEAVFQPRRPSIPYTNLLSPDRRIVLADYIEMSTMAEVFNEITAGVALRQQGLAVFNPEEQAWRTAPLVLLDNVPVYNIEELLKINPAKVEAIEVFQADYTLGNYIIEAVVSISTTTNDFAGYQWGEQVAFTAFKAFAVPPPFEQVVQPGSSHHPDFRPVLYWQPRLRLQQEKTTDTITVYAPDRPGRYEIVVQGFTRSGAACLGHVVFEVVRGG